MDNRNKNAIFIVANIINISAKFQLHPPMASEEKFIEYFFVSLAFRLPLQPNKFRGLDKNDMFGRGLFKKHFFCKTTCSEIAISTIFPQYKSLQL